MEKTWICSYCEKEFPAAEIYMDCEQGHKYCSSCQKLLKLMETDNGDFSLLKKECPLCRHSYWRKRGQC